MKRIVLLLVMILMSCQVATFAASKTTQVLTIGMFNEQVKSVQHLLESEGFYDGEIDGIFGNGTKEAVIQFQEAHGLSADGIVGEDTLATLFATSSDHEEEAHDEVAEAVAVSRGIFSRTAPNGAYLDWWSEVYNKLIFPDDEIVIQDYETGRFFKVVAIAGSKHMDVEALTTEDAHIIKELWGGEYSWDRRAVIAYLDGKAVAASLNGMPHAGRDDLPYKEYVSNRSQGYGYGYNYDKVKNNDFAGVICLHFKNSTLHKSPTRDRRHQSAVRKAAGLE